MFKKRPPGEYEVDEKKALLPQRRDEVSVAIEQYFLSGRGLHHRVTQLEQLLKLKKDKSREIYLILSSFFSSPGKFIKKDELVMDGWAYRPYRNEEDGVEVLSDISYEAANIVIYKEIAPREVETLLFLKMPAGEITSSDTAKEFLFPTDNGIIPKAIPISPNEVAWHNGKYGNDSKIYYPVPDGAVYLQGEQRKIYALSGNIPPGQRDRGTRQVGRLRRIFNPV